MSDGRLINPNYFFFFRYDEFGLSFSNDDADGNDISTSSAVSIFHAIIRIGSGCLIYCKWNFPFESKRKKSTRVREGRKKSRSGFSSGLKKISCHSVAVQWTPSFKCAAYLNHGILVFKCLSNILPRLLKI